MRLWLDDERPAPIGWVWARTYDEAVLFWGCAHFDVVSLDHDLGGEKTGYDFLCFLEQCASEGGAVPAVRIHTANPAGRERMKIAARAMRRRFGIQEGD